MTEKYNGVLKILCLTWHRGREVVIAERGALSSRAEESSCKVTQTLLRRKKHLKIIRLSHNVDSKVLRGENRRKYRLRTSSW